MCSSWVDENLERCYQVMETDDRRVTRVYGWRTGSDLVDFEVHPVITSPRKLPQESGPGCRHL